MGSGPGVPLIPLVGGLGVFSEKLGGLGVLWTKGFFAARSAAIFFLKSDIELISEIKSRDLFSEI